MSFFKDWNENFKIKFVFQFVFTYKSLSLMNHIRLIRIQEVLGRFRLEAFLLQHRSDYGIQFLIKSQALSMTGPNSTQMNFVVLLYCVKEYEEEPRSD